MKRIWATLIMLLMFGAAMGSAVAQVAERTTIGAFAIEATLTSATVPNTNYGRVKQTSATHRLTHKGKPVTTRDASGAAVDLSFWEAWTLPDAPRPAILAANRATYLITEENGEPKVQLLRGAYHDNASWQWLDAGGKVGERYRVYIQDKVQGAREIRGGNALAVSGIVLLDVRTLQTQRMDIAGDFEHLKQANGYTAGDGPIIMYSAQAKQVAALARNEAGKFAAGSRSNPDFALVVLDLPTGAHYSVPFDRNALRLAQEEEDATPAWAANHFEWRADAQGRQRLQLRKLAKPYPWLGRFRDPYVEGSNSTRETSYVLMPTDDRMVAPLVSLIERDFGGRKVPLLNDDLPGLKVRMEVNGLPIAIRRYSAEDDYPPSVNIETSLPVTFTPQPGGKSKSSTSYEPEKIRATNLMVMKLGEHINRQLAQGKLQEFFTAMPKVE